jgi:hypothetical protein
LTLELGRDPSVKSERIEQPGIEIIQTDRWAGALPGSAAAGAVPDSLKGRLARYRNLGRF